jgi:phenylacetate-CoA ligase
MSRVTGRTDDMILFHGVGFFPSQIEEILSEVAGVDPQYLIILDRAAGVDTLEIRTEISGRVPRMDEVKALETLRGQLSKRIRTSLDIQARVTFVELKSLRQVAEGKGRVVDKRFG